MAKENHPCIVLPLFLFSEFCSRVFWAELLMAQVMQSEVLFEGG